MRILKFCGYLKIKIGRQFENRWEKFEGKMATLDKSKSVLEKLFENEQNSTGTREVHPERTVAALFTQMT